MTKRRLSVSVDPDLVDAAERSIAQSGVTLSRWVNDALRLKLEHDRRLTALSAFIASYEAEHGEITDRDIESAKRRARARALPSRKLTPKAARRR